MTKPSPELLGTSLLRLALYWYVVAQFHAWVVGITAFAVALLLNIIHTLLVAKREKQ